MKKIIFPIIIMSIAFACSKKAEETSGEISASKANYEIDTVLSQDPNSVKNDTSRKFIKTIQLKFRVKNVNQASHQIEKIVSQYGGFVTNANLRSNVLKTSITPISEDSVLEVNRYEVENKIELRIPIVNLDTAINSFSNLIDFLDYKVVKSEDVALQMRANKLIMNRVGKHEERLRFAVKRNNKDLNQTTFAEETLYNKIEERDNAMINNFGLKDKVDFSTITLLIYQNETVKKSKSVNLESLENLKSPFGYRMSEALKTGWSILIEIVLFLLRIWAVLVLVGFGYVLYKYAVDAKSKK